MGRNQQPEIPQLGGCEAPAESTAERKDAGLKDCQVQGLEEVVWL